ncbi:transglutaminase-like domain-containing protein [Paraglaciecola sp.]|uniref:transglutaminase-like domain-containing protein n=1 Tax=Paraglaciecola sp. TaxID=1920173 RepID=UPI003EFA1508
MRAFLLVWVLTQATVCFAQEIPSLASIPIELEENVTFPLNAQIRLEFSSSHVNDVEQGLINWSDIAAKKSDKEVLTIVMHAQPKFKGSVKSDYLQHSFVIDIEEDSTQKFIDGFVGEIAKSWKLDHLVEYVNTYIEDPTYIHGFSIASVVANQRSGDCTEYAVLTTTLARALNIPARIILGTVIYEEHQQVSAVGHAWTEVWKDNQWHILDAALYSSEVEQYFYLPASELNNEGPGFSWGMAQAIKLMPKKLKLMSDL